MARQHWTAEEAKAFRASLGSWVEDWDDPAMDVYDDIELAGDGRSGVVGMYCFWTSATERENGDLEITRLQTDPATKQMVNESSVVIPKAERLMIARVLLGDTEPIIAQAYSDFHLHRDSTMRESTPASRRAFGEVFRRALRGEGV